jgi:DNA mismatch repair protein MutL
MSSKIKVLADEVANHIAAGEVIERPASVVKELLENSLDADATHIDIEIGVGGKAYIRVNDNGCGMSREDVCLAFERHATSKIATTADLSSISTLGFRGEALPSIASVSKVKLLTRTPDSLVGTRIDIHGGEIVNVTDSGSAPGTFIEVNDLFYKTPARLKFLKSPATELSYINNVIIDEALAYSQAGFTVKNNAREQLHLPGKSDLLQRIAGLFGREIVRELIEIHESAGSLELRGFIGLPSCHRANRNYQKIFVNRRSVKDKVISHAIQQAYETLIPRKRYPVAFLLLALPPQLVDVNVHPTKMEVRFVNSQTIHDFVINAIRKTLSSSPSRYTVSSFAPSETDKNEQISQNVPQMSCLRKQEQEPPDQTELSSFPAMLTTHSDLSQVTHPHPSQEGIEELNHTDLPSNAILSDAVPLERARNTTANIPSFSPHGITPHTMRFGVERFAHTKPIGQFHETYLLIQAGEDLLIIDQHAAHERIFYEKLKGQFQNAHIEIQQLLFPVSIELSHREQAVLEEHLGLLKQYGLELEPFGGTTYLLKAVPTLLSKADHKKLLYDIVDQLTEIGKTAPVEQILDEILILMSCHGAIRAHQPLQQAQIVALLQQMDAIDYPYTCPHGRPTVVKIDLRDLEKKFGRG